MVPCNIVGSRLFLEISARALGELHWPELRIDSRDGSPGCGRQGSMPSASMALLPLTNPWYPRTRIFIIDIQSSSMSMQPGSTKPLPELKLTYQHWGYMRTAHVKIIQLSVTEVHISRDNKCTKYINPLLHAIKKGTLDKEGPSDKYVQHLIGSLLVWKVALHILCTRPSPELLPLFVVIFFTNSAK